MCSNNVFDMSSQSKLKLRRKRRRVRGIRIAWMLPDVISSGRKEFGCEIASVSYCKMAHYLSKSYRSHHLYQKGYSLGKVNGT